MRPARSTSDGFKDAHANSARVFGWIDRTEPVAGAPGWSPTAWRQRYTSVMRFYLTLLLPVLLLIACTSPHQDPRLANMATPTDFSVVLRVRPAATSALDNPLNEASVQAVEPNRRLGVTRGRSAHTRYPAFSRVLTRQEYDDLFKLVSNNHLIAEPTSPGAEAFGLGKTKASALYEVEITAFGRTNRYRTTPDESPPTVELLTRLIQLRTPPTTAPAPGTPGTPGRSRQP